MAFTEDDVSATNAQLKGPARIRFADGREVQNRPVDELLKLRAIEQAEAGPPSGTRRTRQIRLYSDKGFGC
jgi:hypothetical protein